MEYDLNKDAILHFLHSLSVPSLDEIANAINNKIMPLMHRRFPEINRRVPPLDGYDLDVYNQDNDDILTVDETYGALNDYFQYVSQQTNNPRVAINMIITMFNESFAVDQNESDDDMILSDADADTDTDTDESKLVVRSFPRCVICDELLNNIEGPGPSSKCMYNCNDVVNVCSNRHLFHRGCILESCNADTVDIHGAMGFDDIGQYRVEQSIATTCPICRSPLVPNCAGFKTKSRVNELNIDQDGREMMQGGGGGRKKGKRVGRKKTHSATKQTKSRQLTRKKRKKKWSTRKRKIHKRKTHKHKRRS